MGLMVRVRVPGPTLLVEVEGDEAAFLELNEIDGGGGMDDINELESVFPFDLVAMPSDNSVIGAMLIRRPQIRTPFPCSWHAALD